MKLETKANICAVNAWESLATVSSALYSGGKRSKLGNEFYNGARDLWKNATLTMAQGKTYTHTPGRAIPSLFFYWGALNGCEKDYS